MMGFDDRDEVLRFRPRPSNGAADDEDLTWLGPDEDEFDDEYDDEGFDPGGGDLGDLVQLMVIGNRVVDVVRRPVRGSGYECAALELRYPAPGARSPDVPRLRVGRPPTVPGHELELAWLTRLVGGATVLESLDTTPPSVGFARRRPSEE